MQRYCLEHSFKPTGGPDTAPPCWAPTSSGRLPARLLAPCQAPTPLPACVKGPEESRDIRTLSSTNHKLLRPACRHQLVRCGPWHLWALNIRESPSHTSSCLCHSRSSAGVHGQHTQSVLPPKHLPPNACKLRFNVLHAQYHYVPSHSIYTIDSTAHCAAPKACHHKAEHGQPEHLISSSSF